MTDTPHSPLALQARSRPRAQAPLRVIELLLLWEGAASNERVRQMVGINTTNASRRLAEYALLNPEGLSYSTAQKRYVATPTFRPQLTGGRVDDYLALEGKVAPLKITTIERTHRDFGAALSNSFGTLHRATREGLGVRAWHRSMRHPEPVEKTFYPHTLIEAGRRWHVRAYVASAGTFQDLALTRLSEVTLLDDERPSEAHPAFDDSWNTFVDLRVVPHSALTAAQKLVIRHEYFGGAIARRESVRAALASYVIHDLRAAVDPSRQRPPDFQLEIQNADELSRWLLPGA